MTANGQLSRRQAAAGRATWLRWLCAAAGLLAAPAGAQQEPGADTGFLDEIIVTARKTEESVQDIPMSVQVLSGELLDDIDLTNFLDLQHNIPGFVVNTFGMNGVGYSLRGVAAAVATHLNGVSVGSGALSNGRQFDLERIEILKGPQGTLYGRNATGGSINTITRAPEPEFSADIEAGYGSFDTARLEGQVNLPGDGFAFRLAYTVSEGDGYVRNSVDGRKFGEQDYHGLRASMGFDGGENFRALVMAQHLGDDGARNDLWTPQPNFLPEPSDIRRTTVTHADPFLDMTSDVVAVNRDYDCDSVTLTSVTGYGRSTTRGVDDCAGLPVLADCVRSLLPGKHEQWSQEVRLASRRDNRLEWLVGTYAYDQKSSGAFFQFTPVLDTIPTHDRVSTASDTAYALFGQVAWPVFERWRITTGLRVSDEVHFLSTMGTGREDSPTLIADEVSKNKLSWRLDLERAVGDDWLLYAGAATGFKSGGITILLGGVLDRFGPEELLAFEAGTKYQRQDRRLSLDAAMFWYDFRDMQVNTSTITDEGLIFEVDNAARSEVYGVDATASLRLADSVSISSALVWLPKREFVEYRNDRTGDTLSGNKLVRAPEWTATGSIRYDHPPRRSGQLSARLEYHFRSGFFYTVDNDSRFTQGSFGLLNLFLTYTPTRENWYLFASGRNLGNADYFDQVFLQSSPGYPDTWETGIGYVF